MWREIGAQWTPKLWDKGNLWEEGVHLAQPFMKVSSELKDLVAQCKQWCFLARLTIYCKIQELEPLITNFSHFSVSLSVRYSIYADLKPSLPQDLCQQRTGSHCMATKG